jgi:hypothetical protein
MKSGTYLYTYKSQGLKDNPSKSTIMLVKITAQQNYMLIMGTTAKQNSKPTEDNNLFFEIFSISQQRQIKYVEQNMPMNIKLWFPIDIHQKESTLDDSNQSAYFPAQFYGVFLKKGDKDNGYVNFRHVPLVAPESNGLTGERLWNGYSCKSIGTGALEPFVDGIYDHRLDSGYGTTMYLLEKDSHKYVARFSSYLMQLWKLKPIEEGKEAFQFGDQEPRLNNTLATGNYSGNTLESTLIYTRFYYDLSPYDCFMRKKLWNIDDEDGECKPEIHFTGKEGRILVHVSFNNESFVMDEVLLPFSELRSEVSLDSRPLIDHGSCNMTIDLAKNPVGSMESYLLALIYVYSEKSISVSE